jgi:hypothetical protein
MSAPSNTSQRSDLATHSSSKSPTLKAKPLRKSLASVTLLPITPLHEIIPGAIDVDPARARVVYLAPLTYTAAEKYFARARAKSEHHVDSEAEDTGDGGMELDEALAATRAADAKNLYSRVLSPVNPLLSKLLADHDRRLAKHKAKQDKLCATRTSVFNQRPSYDDDELVDRRPLPTKPRQDDDQIERLKRYVQSLPTTEEAIESFKRTMRTYQQMQMEYRAGLMRNHASPVGFNMEAAWNRTVCLHFYTFWGKEHQGIIHLCYTNYSCLKNATGYGCKSTMSVSRPHVHARYKKMRTASGTSMRRRPSTAHRCDCYGK